MYASSHMYNGHDERWKKEKREVRERKKGKQLRKGSKVQTQLGSSRRRTPASLLPHCRSILLFMAVPLKEKLAQ